jgi:S1-C subfamily serine protease
VAWRNAGKSLPDELIYVSPLPEVVGLKLSNADRARIVSISPGSVAEKAGLRAGDELIAFDGQPLISVADVQWALAGAPSQGTVPVSTRRDGVERPTVLTLPDGWRRNADISWRATTWHLRGMVTGGLLLEDLADDARAERAIPSHQLALVVKHVGEYGIHAAAKQAGFQKDDLIVEIDRDSKRMSESQLIGNLLRKRSAGDRVPVTVLRRSERVALKLPIQ